MPHVFNKTELHKLSQDLLHLHKALLNFEQKNYERGQGIKIQSPGKLLELLMNDAHFAWLRELSQLIVSIDEISENEEAEEKQVQDLIAYTQSLLAGNKEGNEFSQKYFLAVQADPAVAVTHGKIMQMLKD